MNKKDTYNKTKNKILLKSLLKEIEEKSEVDKKDKKDGIDNN